jgi:hypothetical protein
VADSVEPRDLGEWLASLGAPESITNVLPQELRDIDVSSVLKVLSHVNAPTFGSITVETAPATAAVNSSESGIQWLPIVRD